MPTLIERQSSRLRSYRDSDINATPPERGGDCRVDAFVRTAPDAPRQRASTSSFSFDSGGLFCRVIGQA